MADSVAPSQAPVAGVVARGSKKRKQDEPDTQEPDGSGGSKHAKGNGKKKGGDKASPPARQTAVWVTHLPEGTTVALLQSVFSKAGLILEDGNGDPRIKMYYDETSGAFKGEALIVYLQAESVDLAVRLLDETELELGSGKGNMLVKKAEWDKKKDGANGASSSASGSGAQTGASNGGGADKQKAKRRADKLKKKLEDWSSEDEDAGAAAARAKYSKVVVLKGMFTLVELEEDPTLLLDLKEEVRDECEKLGEVTNVTLYDLEPDGIMVVRFKTELGAQACIAVSSLPRLPPYQPRHRAPDSRPHPATQKNNGRYFGGQNISAFLMDGSMKFRKTGQGVSLAGTGFGGEDDLGAEEEEQARRDKYAAWLESEGAKEKDS